jgi:hypothetical protein
MDSDWSAAARALAPEIPAEDIERIAPVLASLERTLRAPLGSLPLDLELDLEFEP